MKSPFPGLLALALLPVSVGAQGPGGTPLLEIETSAVDITPLHLDGLRLRGSVVLSADHPEFGGFSGLLMDRLRMVAVTDKGWWLLAELSETGSGLEVARAGFAPMRGEGGETFDKAGGDAEGLTLRDGQFVVSFERDHRLMFHIEEGQLGDTVRNRAFRSLGSNKGLEALATTSDGWVIAIAERPADRTHPVYVLRYSGEIDNAALPEIRPYYVTGADVGPDGRLYVLRRNYSTFLGVSIAVHRYDLDEDGYPLAPTVRKMAEFDSASGVDNMEGLALWTDAEGRTRMTLISDDNFNLIQRTLLMDFEVLNQQSE